MSSADNDRWLSRKGEAIDSFRKGYGGSALSPQDRLIEVFWLVAHSMRSTGDLAAARHRNPNYLETGLSLATSFGLPAATSAFSSREGGLERHFFDLFDDICIELREL
jgi:hypothetical protein